MEKLFDGVVLCDELFLQYHAYTEGRTEAYSRNTINQLMKYRRSGFVANVMQYNRCGISIPENLEPQLRRYGLTDQSLSELAKTHTYYKIVLSDSKSSFPFVNILSKDEKIDVSMTGSFTLHENRNKAKEHIAALCSNAKEILLFDKHIDNPDQKENIKAVLNYILPKDHPVKVKSYVKLPGDVIHYLKRDYGKREFDNLGVDDADTYHDRYIIVDKTLEILLSSGFDHLAKDVSDLTYVIRPIEKSRF